MKTSLEKQIDDFNNNKYQKVFTNFLVRIQVTHGLAVLVLMANCIFFTENTTAQIIQLMLAFVVILHDFDDSYLKKALSRNINELNNTNKNLENTKVEKSTNSYSVNGKFSILDKDNVKTNFKVGLHRWEQEFDKSKEKGADIFYGVGVDIPLSKQVSASTNYETYKLKDSNLDKISIGFTYKF